MAKISREETQYVQRVEILMPLRGVHWIDMLRYDRCFPATEQDAGKLSRIAEGSAVEADRRVNFIRVTGAKSQPQEARWENFGCKILFFAEPL
jgi:hypothetical protein